MNRKPVSLALFLTEASCCDFLQYAIAPWMGLSISELALLLLLSTGPKPESLELGMEEDEFDEEHDDDEADDVLFDDEYPIMTLENDLLCPHSSSLSFPPSVVLLLMGEAVYLLLLIWPNGFLQLLTWAVENSFALGASLLSSGSPALAANIVLSTNTGGCAFVEIMLRIELTTSIT